MPGMPYKIKSIETRKLEGAKHFHYYLCCQLKGGGMEIFMKNYSNLITLIPYIKKSKVYLILGIIGMMFVSAIEAPIPYFIGKVLDIVVENSVAFYDIQGILLTILFIYIIKFLISIIYQYLFAKLQQNVVNEIRMSMLERIIDAPLDFINQREKGYILSRIGESQQVGAIFSPTIITSFVGIFEIIFCFIVMFTINLKLSIFSLLIIPVYFIISQSISKKITKNTIKMQEDAAKLNADVFETLNGIEEIKLLNAKRTQLDKILIKIKILVKSAIKQSLSMIAFIQDISFTSDLVTVGILALAGYYIIEGEITVGVYTAFSLYIGKILGVTQSIGTFEITIKPVCATIERIKEFLNLESETNSNAYSLRNDICEVVFENVSFGYNNSDLCIKNFSQEFVTGDRVLLLGRNGSGKTTIVKLLSGLYEPVEGKILINRRDARDIKKEDLRKRIGIVSQNIFLFRGTVIENILLGAKGKTEKDILRLLKEFELTNYIDLLPNGLHTEIIQDGVGVSGGQAQIIAFIRAIIEEKDILILDEATSNLDQETCRKIISILQKNELCKILIIISHQQFEYEFINKRIQL